MLLGFWYNFSITFTVGIPSWKRVQFAIYNTKARQRWGSYFGVDPYTTTCAPASLEKLLPAQQSTRITYNEYSCDETQPAWYPVSPRFGRYRR